MATTTQRGYGAAHQRTRKEWEAAVNEGGITCCLCGEPVEAWMAWDLDHQPGTTSHYRGVAHAKCNRSDGAKRGNATRTKPKRLEI